jgi:hypothetical protein
VKLNKLARPLTPWDTRAYDTYTIIPDSLVFVGAYRLIGINSYIEVFYNRQRCHSANGYLAPLAYEQTLKTHGILCPEKC